MASDLPPAPVPGASEDQRDRSHSERLKLKTIQVTIQAGSAQEIPVSVFPGCSVEWNFQTEGGDIAFGIILEDKHGQVSQIVEEMRYEANEETIHGKLLIEKSGTLWLRWDNTYSWFTNKELVYSVTRDPISLENKNVVTNSNDAPQNVAAAATGSTPSQSHKTVTTPSENTSTKVPTQSEPVDASAASESMNVPVPVVSPVTPPVRIILGTMTMGGQVSPNASLKMLEKFVVSPCVQKHLTSGKAEIDTARMYQHGKTEMVLGDIMGDDLKKRFYIATKANPFKGYNESLRPESVAAQVEASLKAMRVESVDLLYLHAPDHSTSIEVTLEACQQLYLAGKFRELGLSNYTAWETVHIWHLCKERGWVQPTVYQGMYNALTRQVEKELFPALKELNIRFYAYNPLAGGMLAGKHTDINDKPKDGRFGHKAFAQMYGLRFWKESYFEALEVVRKACEDHQISMSSAAIRWLMHHSELQGGLNDGVIIGVSSMKHLESNLAAANNGPLPLQIVSAFDMAWLKCEPACPQYFR
mmetsp:Transcript_1634/g.2466  ORF Transcript_1634/g.2466 Transcript_1634/m.2466 type:complete len:530 (+) Transcript_1634:189-1778(+)